MQCNIDARGKRIRLISGAIDCGAGVVLLVVAAVVWPGQLWIWVVGSVAMLAGAFQVFEGRAGWCAVRAMGFKTRW